MKTKIKYIVEREDGLIWECSSLEEAKIYEKELSYRRTGKTTRLFFEALSLNPTYNENIFFIYQTNSQAKFHLDYFCDFLTRLGFKFNVKFSERTVENHSKIFHFTTADNLDCKLKGLKNTKTLYDT